MAAPTIPSRATPPTASPVFPSSFATSDDSDVEDNYNQSQQTFSNTAKAISIGWIIGIVVIVLAVIIATIIAVWMYRRNRKRKRERLARLNAETKPNWPTNGYQGPGGPPSQPPPDSALGYGGPSELAGQEPPPRYEIPNTEVLPREMPNNEIARPLPTADGSHSNQRSELPV
ncbi:Alkyltransferase-like protein 1 [Hypoxylon texense]